MDVQEKCVVHNDTCFLPLLTLAYGFDDHIPCVISPALDPLFCIPGLHGAPKKQPPFSLQQRKAHSETRLYSSFVVNTCTTRYNGQEGLDDRAQWTREESEMCTDLWGGA